MAGWTVSFLSFLAWISSLSHGVDAADSWLKSPPAFMQLRWPNASLLHVSLTEPALLTASKTFYTTDSVTVLNVRNATLFDSSSRATFEMLFLIGDPTQAFITTSNPTLTTVGLVAALSTSLETAVRTAAGDKNVSEPLWQAVAAFQGNAVTCASLSSTDVLALYKSAPNFPAIRAGATPAGTAFLTFNVFFRNVNDPLKLAQSVVFQVRRGVAEFLGGEFNLSSVVSSGPATMATDSTLQVNQTFFLKLPAADTSLQARQVLANRVLFGDLHRHVPGTTHPAMFLDFIFASTELSVALSSLAIAGSQAFASTLTPYVFRYMNFDTFPSGNPELPDPVADTATLARSVSQDAWNALHRKKVLFHYDPDATVSSDVSPNSLDLYGVFTTTVYWANLLTSDFWLESAESIDPVTWNLFPHLSLFTEDSTSLTLLAPVVRIGNTSTPLWTLQAADPGKLDMALNFRSTDDNTLVKVELAVSLHPSGDAESTVTSIARAGGSTGSVNPLNVVVRHQSRLLRNEETGKARNLLLYLEFGVANVTEKTVGGCAHCQQLLDWCSNESGCLAMKECVLSAIQNPIANLIATPTTLETNDLSSLVNSCLAGTATSPVDVNYLLLFTSVVRCQLRRLCPLQSTIVIPSNVQLVWGNGVGQQRIQPAQTISNFPEPTKLPLNISLSIGGRVVCFIPVWNNVTASELESKITRSCTFAKYLGTVRANVTSNTAGATSIDLIYDGLIGPLPVLSSVSSTEAIGATISTIVNPSLTIRFISAGGPIPFAATTDRPPTDACVECKRLAIDVCLRDAKCAAMADCIMQQRNDTSATVATDVSTTTSLADAMLKLVRADQTGTKLSFESGISSCIPAVITDGVSSIDVHGASWRKLVNASACYSRTACPLALASVLSSSWSSLASNYLTVGKWAISPSRKLQRLIYTGPTSTLASLTVPLSLTREGTLVTNSSAADPESLSASLRRFIHYDDIQVVQATVDSSTSSSSSTTTKFAWTISYGHWAGTLPTFIPSDSKEWMLVGYPTIVNGVVTPKDSILELVPRSSSAIATTTA